MQINPDIIVNNKNLGQIEESVTNLEDQKVYSANEEVKTGEKWIDGKDVYRKIITLSSLPNATIQQYNHNIADVDNIWFDFSLSYVKFTDSSVASLPYIGGDLSTAIEYSGATSTTYSINTHSRDRRQCTGQICLKYTKK